MSPFLAKPDLHNTRLPGWPPACPSPHFPRCETATPDWRLPCRPRPASSRGEPGKAPLYHLFTAQVKASASPVVSFRDWANSPNSAEIWRCGSSARQVSPHCSGLESLWAALASGALEEAKAICMSSRPPSPPEPSKVELSPARRLYTPHLSAGDSGQQDRWHVCQHLDPAFAVGAQRASKDTAPSLHTTGDHAPGAAALGQAQALRARAEASHHLPAPPLLFSYQKSRSRGTGRTCWLLCQSAH